MASFVQDDSIQGTTTTITDISATTPVYAFTSNIENTLQSSRSLISRTTDASDIDALDIDNLNHYFNF